MTTSIAPWFSVRNIAKAVNFYKSAFGAVEVYKLENPEGVLQVARLSIDGAEFWLSEEPDLSNSHRESVGGNSVRMILTVTDPDTIFNRALQAGAVEVFPVGEDHGWRLGRLIDPFGLHWEIGRPL
jgi:PhnB protein